MVEPLAEQPFLLVGGDFFLCFTGLYADPLSPFFPLLLFLFTVVLLCDRG